MSLKPFGCQEMSLKPFDCQEMPLRLFIVRRYLWSFLIVRKCHWSILVVRKCLWNFLIVRKCRSQSSLDDSTHTSVFSLLNNSGESRFFVIIIITIIITIVIIFIIVIIIIAKCAGSWLSQNAIVSGFEEGGGAGVWEGQRRRRRRWWWWWWSWNENDDHGDVSVNGYHHDEEIVSNPTCNNKIFLFQIENISSEQLQQVQMIISHFPSSSWSSAISSPSSSRTSTGAEHNHRQLPAREGSKTAGRQRRSKSRKRMFHHLGLELAYSCADIAAGHQEEQHQLSGPVMMTVSPSRLTIANQQIMMTLSLMMMPASGSVPNS